MGGTSVFWNNEELKPLLTGRHKVAHFPIIGCEQRLAKKWPILRYSGKKRFFQKFLKSEQQTCKRPKQKNLSLVALHGLGIASSTNLQGLRLRSVACPPCGPRVSDPHLDMTGF